jgi:hypothetical protein
MSSAVTRSAGVEDQNDRQATAPKYRAVLPPEFEGVDLDEGGGEPVPFDVWDAGMEARLEADWAKHD